MITFGTRQNKTSTIGNAGRWDSEMHKSRSFPVIQIITVAQLLAGESPNLPTWGVATFKKASGSKRDETHPELFD
jgi:hypothetical protein